MFYPLSKNGFIKKKGYSFLLQQKHENDFQMSYTKSNSKHKISALKIDTTNAQSEMNEASLVII